MAAGGAVSGEVVSVSAWTAWAAPTPDDKAAHIAPLVVKVVI